MATSFVIACPECKKQIKVSDQVVGKKIRCKECEAVFTVKAPKGGKPAAPAADRAKPKSQDDAPVLAAADDDDDEETGGGGKSANPYALAATDDHLPRCPFCAKEMESAEAIICLHCGYNTRTRTRADTKKVHAHTGGEIFLWLLPGIICAILVLGILAFDALCWVKMKDWARGSWMQGEETTTSQENWVIRPHAFTLYITVAMVSVALALGRFAVRRLFINNKPPERALEKDDGFDDDE